MVTSFQLVEGESVSLEQGLERLARYVHEVRSQKNLSLERIRDAGGPSIGWLSQLESGQLVDEPRPSTLRKLAKGLGVSLFDLVEASGIGYFEVSSKTSVAITPDKGPLEHASSNLDDLAHEAHPPTPDERRVYHEALALGIVPFSLKLPEFWAWTPEERRPTFRNLEGLIEEEKRNQARFKHG